MVVDIPEIEEVAVNADDPLMEIVELNADIPDAEVEVVEIGFEDLVDPQRDMPHVIAKEVMHVHGDEPVVPVEFVDVPPQVN